MKLPRDLAGRALVKALFLLASNLASHAAGVDVLTHHNDTMRTGANLNETILTPANVNSGQFGKLFDQPVDGNVYAQPLYVSGLTVSGTVHNVVFVATEHDSVYAFDADSDAGPNAAPLMAGLRSSIPAMASRLCRSRSTEANNIAPEIGITGTPVIDRTPGTLYVVAKTKENGAWFQRLHALDLATGAGKARQPGHHRRDRARSRDGGMNGLYHFRCAQREPAVRAPVAQRGYLHRMGVPRR